MARRSLAWLGGFLIVAGVFFALQGAGVIMWPAESFMLERSGWVTNGIAIALVGAMLVGLARRKRR